MAPMYMHIILYHARRMRYVALTAALGPNITQNFKLSYTTEGILLLLYWYTVYLHTSKPQRTVHTAQDVFIIP